jgi:hypothetical protein
MLFQARLEDGAGGEFVATCPDPRVSARGLSPASALERLRAEIRYRIEICPCSSVDDDFVELELVPRG